MLHLNSSFSSISSMVFQVTFFNELSIYCGAMFAIINHAVLNANKLAAHVQKYGTSIPKGQ